MFATLFSSRLNDYRSTKKRWDMSRLPRFDKDFYKEHSSVAARSDVSYALRNGWGEVYALGRGTVGNL